MKAQKLRGREKILSARIATIFILATLLIPTHLARAVPITIEISGEVTSVGGYTEAIPDTIYAGVTFTGTYTYDSSTVDSGGGHYVHDAPYGITLFLGGYVFNTAPAHLGQFDMRIADDLVGNGVWDYYLVRSYENVADPSVDFIISSMEWNLWDSTHTALSSGDLPVTAPELSDWDHNVLKIHGLYGTNLTGLTIYATVTQAVPEPLTGFLMVIGVLFLKRRGKAMNAQNPRVRKGFLSAPIATIFVLAILLLPAPLAKAVPITIEITGEVTSASGSALPGTIYEGVSFTGSYTYDSSNVDSGGGHYVHDAPYGISLFLGGYEFKTSPGHVGQFDMRIADDLEGNGVWDYYSVRSQYENISVPSVGFNIGTIRWDLMDSTHTALSSGDLPLTAPVINDWDYNYFEILGSDGLGNGLWIRGTVTQAVPEPLTGVLMATGVFFWRRRRKTIKAQKPLGRKGYLSARFLTFLVFAILLLPAPLARAVPITIEITGEVISVEGDVGSVPSTIYAGVSFTGTYTYDSSTSDSDASQYIGKYEHNSPYGISLLLGGYEFTTATNHIGKFNISIHNDDPQANLWDYYIVESDEIISAPPVGFSVDHIRWILGDITHTALDSYALPVTPPVLTDWGYNVLRISGSGDLGGLLIEGTVTQAVPEPLSVILMVMGMLFIRCRR
jgi:hypothetical protein